MNDPDLHRLAERSGRLARLVMVDAPTSIIATEVRLVVDSAFTVLEWAMSRDTQVRREEILVRDAKGDENADA